MYQAIDPHLPPHNTEYDLLNPYALKPMEVERLIMMHMIMPFGNRLQSQTPRPMVEVRKDLVLNGRLFTLARQEVC